MCFVKFYNHVTLKKHNTVHLSDNFQRRTLAMKTLLPKSSNIYSWFFKQLMPPQLKVEGNFVLPLSVLPSVRSIIGYKYPAQLLIQFEIFSLLSVWTYIEVAHVVKILIDYQYLLFLETVELCHLILENLIA